MTEQQTHDSGPQRPDDDRRQQFAQELLRPFVLECRASIMGQLAFADQINLGFIWDRHGYVELGGGDA